MFLMQLYPWVTPPDVQDSVNPVINGTLIGNNMGGMMRGLRPFQFVPLDQGAVEISTEVEPWLSSWCKKSLVRMSTSGFVFKIGREPSLETISRSSRNFIRFVNGSMALISL